MEHPRSPLTFTPVECFYIAGRGTVHVGPWPVNEAGEREHFAVGDTIEVNGEPRKLVGIERISGGINTRSNVGLCFAFNEAEKIADQERRNNSQATKKG